MIADLESPVHDWIENAQELAGNLGIQWSMCFRFGMPLVVDLWSLALYTLRTQFEQMFAFAV